MNTTRRLILSLALAMPGLPAIAAGGDDRVLTPESFRQIRAQHAGQPLVVHLWGMTCGPCLTELPKWGELLRQRPGMRLVLIQADQTPPRAGEATLRKAGLARAERWHVESEMDEFLRASIDPKWQGEMPTTLLIAPGGEVTRIAGAADLAKVARWLDAPSAPRR